jgi:2-octaprenyl-6-methoxyphenol hydroxylase
MLDVVIIGGGHAGLWLGAAAVRFGLAVAVVDPTPPEMARAAHQDGRTLALLGGSRRVAEAHGIWDHVAPVGHPVRRVEVLEPVAGARVEYDAASLGMGDFAYGVESPALRAALATAFLSTAGEAAWLTGSLASWRREGASVVVGLVDGRELRARLLIGADGRASKVRSLARIEVSRAAYGQAALAFIVRHERPHGDAVRERLRPAGPLALLPVGRRRCGVTWVEAEATARALATAPPQELTRRLDEETGGVLGAVALDSPIAAWPLGAQHARRYVSPRMALIGDAAHGVHPIHAQGFNMGVADIAALLDRLMAARRGGQDIGAPDVLLGYERDRWWDNERRLRLTDGLNRLFSNDLLPARLVRGAVLRALDSMPPLKALAVREGMRAG